MSISRTQMQEVQALCRQQGGRHSYYGASTDKTPDGKFEVRAGYESGSCGSDGFSWLTVQNDRGEQVYRKQKKDYDVFHNPTIAPEADVVFAQQKDAFVELPVQTGLLRRLRGTRKLFEAKQVSAAQASPDGKQVAVADGNDLKIWTRHPGWFSGRSNPATVGTLAEPARRLEYLTDGSLLAMPSDWEKRVWVVDAKSGALERVPMKEMDLPQWQSNVKSGAPWLEPKDADWLVNDEGDVARHAAHQSPVGQDVAVVMDRKLYIWDPVKAEKREAAQLAVGDNTPTVKWTSDARRVVVSERDGNTRDFILADPTSGQCTRIEDVHDEAEQAGRMAFGSLAQRSVTIWDGQQLRETPLEPADTTRTLQDVSVQWTEDGAHAVAFSRAARMQQYDLHVIAADGSGHTVIPCADASQLEGDELSFRIGDTRQSVSIPHGLESLKEQPWYVSADTAALFPGGGAKKNPNLRVEQGEDQVNIGGVVVPVRTESE